MAWTNSKIFSAHLTDALAGTAAFDLNSDVPKAALYNDTITPDQTVAAASSAYNTGVWGVANEQSDGTNWNAGGEPITSPTLTFASNVVTFDGVDTPQAGATCTLNNVYGTLVYDSTLATPVANQGICFNYFGGLQTVTAGTFTVVWAGGGIYFLTL